VASYPVVKYFKVFKNLSSSLFFGLKSFREYMPFLERRKKRFGHRVVVAIPGAAHALLDEVSFKNYLDSMIDILFPTVRMKNQTRCYRSSSQSHLQGDVPGLVEIGVGKEHGDAYSRE